MKNRKVQSTYKSKYIHHCELEVRPIHIVQRRVTHHPTLDICILAITITFFLLPCSMDHNMTTETSLRHLIPYMHLHCPCDEEHRSVPTIPQQEHRSLLFDDMRFRLRLGVMLSYQLPAAQSPSSSSSALLRLEGLIGGGEGEELWLASLASVGLGMKVDVEVTNSSGLVATE